MLLLSGYAGFRFTAERVAHSPGVSEEATDSGESAKAIDSPAPETPPLEPRVKVAIPPALDAQAASAQSRSTPLGLAVEGGVFSPSFSADGSQLYFHQGREAGRLLEASLAGGNRGLEPRAVLDDDAHNFHARPSPDGRWIAFDSDRDGTRAVYVMAPDGRDLRKVSGDGFAVIPSWSPDMKWLAFVKAEASRPRVWNLWLRELSSGAMKRVSAFRSGQVWSASWFPDGRAICYSHDDQLIVTDLATGRHRIFDTPIRGRLTRTPAVSPDGSRIVFQVLGDGVWMLDVATGGMRRILDDGTAEEFAWDPRGRRIAYHSRRDGQWRIWVLTL
jgi:TolB protein